MAESERSYLLDLWEKNVCPGCKREIPQGARVGSGKKSEGGFCSLNCYIEYHKFGLVAGVGKAASFARNQNS